MGRRVRPHCVTNLFNFISENEFGTIIRPSKFILMLFRNAPVFNYPSRQKSVVKKMTNPLSRLLQEAEDFNINGLLFQHIVLCPTRTWLHYHRIDCAHLNRHMQAGILVHETAYGGIGAKPYFGFGIAPDSLDFKKREISEIKKSKSREASAISQLSFYLLVMQQTTQQTWKGILRYPNSRRTKRIEMDENVQSNLLKHFEQIKTVITQTHPPEKEDKPLCKQCSYRILCWGLSTDEGDYY